MIAECWNEHGEHRAVELDPMNRAYGWVYYKGADGQWVTLRKATEDEMRRADEANRAINRFTDSASENRNASST